MYVIVQEEWLVYLFVFEIVNEKIKKEIII